MRNKKNLALQVRLTDIGHRGLSIEEELDLADLNQRMNETPDNDIIFTTAPKVSLLVNKLPEGAEVNGKINASYRQPCGRCTDLKDRELSINFRYQLKPHKKESLADEIDDLGLIFYTGEHVNLSETLQERVILAISPFFMPELDSQGSCGECSQNFKGQTQTSAKTNSLASALSQINLKKV